MRLVFVLRQVITTRSDLADSDSSVQDEDRVRSSLGMKTVYGFHF